MLRKDLPVITKEMMNKPAIEQIIKGACQTLAIQRKNLNRQEEDAQFRYLAMSIASEILDVCDENFNSLLEYVVCYFDETKMPFSMQYSFMFDYSACFSILEGINKVKLDKIMTYTLEYLEDYVQTIFKVVILLEVADGNVSLVDEDYQEPIYEVDYSPEEDEVVEDFFDSSADVLEATPVQ